MKLHHLNPLGIHPLKTSLSFQNNQSSINGQKKVRQYYNNRNLANSCLDEEKNQGGGEGGSEQSSMQRRNCTKKRSNKMILGHRSISIEKSTNYRLAPPFTKNYILAFLFFFFFLLIFSLLIWIFKQSWFLEFPASTFSN